MPSPLAATAVLITITMLALWGLGLALRDVSIVDVFWGFGFVMVAHFVRATAAGLACDSYERHEHAGHDRRPPAHPCLRCNCRSWQHQRAGVTVGARTDPPHVRTRRSG